MSTTIEQAIRESIEQDRIITLDASEVTPEARAFLIEQAEDYSEGVQTSGLVLEAWGETGAGDEWRVHVRGESLR